MPFKRQAVFTQHAIVRLAGKRQHHDFDHDKHRGLHNIHCEAIVEREDEDDDFADCIVGHGGNVPSRGKDLNRVLCGMERSHRILAHPNRELMDEEHQEKRSEEGNKDNANNPHHVENVRRYRLATSREEFAPATGRGIANVGHTSSRCTVCSTTTAKLRKYDPSGTFFFICLQFTR